jgi:hypothetical protein
LSLYASWFRLYAAHVATASGPASCMHGALAVLWQLERALRIPPTLAVYRVWGRPRARAMPCVTCTADYGLDAVPLKSLLEMCGKRGLAKEARFVFRDMAAANVQADAVAYGWHVQAVAANGNDPVAVGAAPKHRSLLFDQPLEMGRIEVLQGAICRKWCARPPPPCAARCAVSVS